ncbi:hypothetical protein VP01_609g2 [Puccinia sorghi]|uniref:Uncharacterized protein n=1 Tax=Puccinia sorghi TaxID=27349 RepID=A0A0L6UH30_9BASI|nr:hypothetical protein VP01_609g2 [Puccinia sorghi]
MIFLHGMTWFQSALTWSQIKHTDYIFVAYFDQLNFISNTHSLRFLVYQLISILKAHRPRDFFGCQSWIIGVKFWYSITGTYLNKGFKMGLMGSVTILPSLPNFPKLRKIFFLHFKLLKIVPPLHSHTQYAYSIYPISIMKRPGMIHPSSDSQISIVQPINIINKTPPIKQKSFPPESETKSQITPIYSKKKGKKTSKNPPTCSQSNLDPIKHKRQRRDLEFKNFKNFFFESYCHKGYVRINSLWFVNLIISHQVPINFCGTRKNSVYLEATCQIFGPIVMALGSKLLATSLQDIKTKGDTKKDQYLVTSTKQRRLITKLSIKASLGGLFFKWKWASTSGHLIYLDLQEAMLNQLKLCNSPHLQKVTVPKHLHMQTDGGWMATCLEHAACQLQAVEQVSFSVPPPHKLNKYFLGSVPYSHNLKFIEEDVVAEEESDFDNNISDYFWEKKFQQETPKFDNDNIFELFNDPSNSAENIKLVLFKKDGTLSNTGYKGSKEPFDILEGITAKRLSQLPAVDMQKVPGSFYFYSNHSPKVIQPDLMHSDCAKTSTYVNMHGFWMADLLEYVL